VRANLAIAVPCGGAEHRIALGVDRAGRLHIRLCDHDERNEAVLEVLGGPPAPCRTLRVSLKKLRSVLGDASACAQWAAMGVRSTGDLAAWHEAGVRDPHVAGQWERWLKVTDAAAVASWLDCGFNDPRLAAPWAAQGFGAELARRYQRWSIDVDVAARFAAKGDSDPSSVAGWREAGVHTPPDRAVWFAIGVGTGREAAGWVRLGARDPVTVGSWRQAGVTGLEDAEDWARAGARAERFVAVMQMWQSAGVTRGSDAADWALVGGTGPSEVRRWLAEGVRSGTELGVWRDVGVEHPDELSLWRTLCPDGWEEARHWRDAGVRRPADLRFWAEIGITDPLEALRWVEPAFVYGLAEVAAFVACGIADPEVARRLRHKGRTPPAVGQACAQDRKRLRSSAHDGRPGAVLEPSARADRRAVRTERYFYGFGHHCSPEAATDYIDVDVDRQGNEISRRWGAVRSVEDPHAPLMAVPAPVAEVHV